MRASVAGLAVGVVFTGSAFAQYIISAHSGVIQYVEGTAYLNDQKVEPTPGQFPDIKENQVFRTEEGKAEVLLTPGVFLRLADSSSVRMISAKLTDTRVEVVTGSAMVEMDDVAKDNSVMLVYKANNILLVKHGLYRVDADQGMFKVYEGEAIVKDESGQLTVRKGKDTLLNGALMAENFDPKADDDLYRWSDRRSGYLAKANVSSANNLMAGGYSGYGGGFSGLGFGGLGGYGGYGGYGCGGAGFGLWQYNSMFGLNTYVPCNGLLYSPFGYGFYSPSAVWQAPYYGGGGGGILNRTGTGTGKHTPFLPQGTGSRAAARSSQASSGGGGGVHMSSASSSSVGLSSAGAGHASGGGHR